MRRMSVNEKDPGYCPPLNEDWDVMGEVKIYLKDAPDAKIYFETVDQDKREAVIFVFDSEGKKVVLGDEAMRVTITDVDIVVEMCDKRRAAIEDWFKDEECVMEGYEQLDFMESLLDLQGVGWRSLYPYVNEDNYANLLQWATTQHHKKKNKSIADKIAKGINGRDIDFFYGRLDLLIKTLKAASVWRRLVYLFTGKIPPTAPMRSVEGTSLTMPSYEDWLKN